MNATVVWKNDLVFEAQYDNGNVMPMSGDGSAPSPMEAVLGGLGGCTSVDVVMILQKMEEDVTGCSLRLTTERAETAPRVFKKIHIHYTVTGRNLKPEHVEKACTVSMEKYCSVALMLGGRVDITYSWSTEEA